MMSENNVQKRGFEQIGSIDDTCNVAKRRRLNQDNLLETHPRPNENTNSNVMEVQSESDYVDDSDDFDKDNEVMCDVCGDKFGKEESWDKGWTCRGCKDFVCDKHWFKFCDSCDGIFCEICVLEDGEFKPTKNGGKQCYHCQPWWMKSRPATDFCSGCSSARQDAKFCIKCGERYCCNCQMGVWCNYCSEFSCESCDGMEYCESCDFAYCPDCDDMHYNECEKTKDEEEDEDMADALSEAMPSPMIHEEKEDHYDGVNPIDIVMTLLHQYPQIVSWLHTMEYYGTVTTSRAHAVKFLKSLVDSQPQFTALINWIQQQLKQRRAAVQQQPAPSLVNNPVPNNAVIYNEMAQDYDGENPIDIVRVLLHQYPQIENWLKLMRYHGTVATSRPHAVQFLRSLTESQPQFITLIKLIQQQLKQRRTLQQQQPVPSLIHHPAPRNQVQMQQGSNEHKLQRSEYISRDNNKENCEITVNQARTEIKWGTLSTEQKEMIERKREAARQRLAKTKKNNSSCKTLTWNALTEDQKKMIQQKRQSALKRQSHHKKMIDAENTESHNKNRSCTEMEWEYDYDEDFIESEVDDLMNFVSKQSN